MDDSTFSSIAVDTDEREQEEAPVLTLMWHPDPSRIGERFFLPPGPTELSRHSPMFAPLGGHEGRALSGRQVSRQPVELRRSGQLIELRGNTIVNGTPAQAGVRIHAQELRDGVTIELGRHVVILAHLADPAEPDADASDTLGLVGVSDAMRRLRADIRSAGRSHAPVLIRGETGSGKELVARAIHQHGLRAQGPYRAINVGAVPAEVAASAFFGHVRGAFSGAHQAQPGYFETSAGGTLFLDEIGELPTALQPMLLRALELGEIQPVGARATRTIDVRIIAATDAALELAMQAKRFSRPLFHRLAGLELQVPPLYTRRDDITRLLYFGLERELKELGALDRLELLGARKPWLEAQTVALLCRHAWPGNVRELLNLARQLALAGSTREQIRTRHVPALERIEQAAASEPPPLPGQAIAPEQLPAPERPLLEGPTPTNQPEPGASVLKPGAGSPASPHAEAAELDKVRVLAALRKARWSIPAAARDLGVAKSTLYRFIDHHALVRKASDISDAELLDAWRAHAGDRAAMSDGLQVSPRALALRLSKLELPELD